MNEVTKNRKRPPASFSLGIHDVLFIVFKRKWLILVFTLFGIGGAAALYMKQSVVYESQASLLVKYVIAHSNLDSWETETQAGGYNGQFIINNEIQLLKSLDVARNVVETVGVEHFVGSEDLNVVVADAEDEEDADAEQEELTSDSEDSGADEPNNRRTSDRGVAAAAAGLRQNIGIGAVPGTNVIQISYQNGDPSIVQRVLEVYVEEYFEKHLSVYRPRREDFVSLRDEESALRLKLPGLRSSLEDLEERFRKVSRGDTTANLKQQRGEVQGRLLVADAELAQQEMVVKMLSARETEENEQAADGNANDAAAPEPIPVPDRKVVRRYQNLRAMEQVLQERKMALMGKFLPGAGALAPVEAQLAQVEQERDELVAEHPGLVAAAVARDVAAGGKVDVNMVRANLAAIQIRIKKYVEQLEALESRIAGLADLEAQIEATEHQIEVATKEFDDLGDRLKAAEREQKIDHRNIPNIDILQHPSNPYRTTNEKEVKLILGVAGGGLALGLLLAFLLEVVLDRRIKRPAEIESRFHMPLMLVIPKLGMRSAVPRLNYAEENRDEEGNFPPKLMHQAPAPGSEQMLGFTEAIRDRLLYYFELRGMRQKPKLIALTGLSKGAGTSTVAAGVATAFGRSGAKVLLVDLHGDKQGSGGLLTNGDDGDSGTSLGIDKVDGMTFNTAGINLSLATFRGNDKANGGGTIAPRRFYELMPKFRGTDFDYVIFDMPSIDSTSATAAMAGFMDKVVLVLDAENTDREELRRGYADLTRGEAEVSCVFNKTRNHAPRWVAG